MANPLRQKTPSPAQQDPFFHGWRFVKKVMPDGREDLVQVPLTLEDCLHPQEEDHISEHPRHNMDRDYLGVAIRTWLGQERQPLVFCDCMIDWGMPEVGNHAPDVSVFLDVQQVPQPLKGTFDVRTAGGRPVLAIELVSPYRRSNDVVHKLREYHQVGVELYVIVDQKRENGPRHILGYRWAQSGYKRLQLDDDGRLLLEPLGLKLGFSGECVRLFDAETGEELGDYTQLAVKLDAEAAARKTAERRARAARKQARLAEEKASAESAARLAIEVRLRQLEAELRRARGGS